MHARPKIHAITLEMKDDEVGYTRYERYRVQQEDSPKPVKAQDASTFAVGDYVEYVGKYASPAVSLFGKVIVVDARLPRILVEFPERRGIFHSAEGRVPFGHGYWFYEYTGDNDSTRWLRKVS